MAPKGQLRPVEIVRDATVVHGGGGSKGHPWLPHIDVIDGKEFVAVDRGDREFARFTFCVALS